MYSACVSGSLKLSLALSQSDRLIPSWTVRNGSFSPIVDDNVSKSASVTKSLVWLHTVLSSNEVLLSSKVASLGKLLSLRELFTVATILVTGEVGCEQELETTGGTFKAVGGPRELAVWLRVSCNVRCLMRGSGWRLAVMIFAVMSSSSELSTEPVDTMGLVAVVWRRKGWLGNDLCTILGKASCIKGLGLTGPSLKTYSVHNR